MIKDKIARAWGRSSRTAPGSPPAAERGSWSRVLLKHWSWILLMTAAVTAGAVALSEMQTPIYKAQAVVAVYPPSWAGSAVPILTRLAQRSVVALARSPAPCAMRITWLLETSPDPS